MVRLLAIASLLLLSHVSLVAANTVPLAPGEIIISRADCRKYGQCESHDIELDPLNLPTHLMHSKMR